MVDLGWIVDRWIYGVANCPDDGALGNLNSAEVTRDGKDRGGVINEITRSTAPVVQDPRFVKIRKNMVSLAGSVCNIALLHNRPLNNEMEGQDLSRLSSLTFFIA